MSFERTPVRDGEVLEIGPRMRVTAVATPGHTFTHLSYTYPAYYAHMAPANSAGPSEPDLSPPAVADPAEVRRRIEASEWASIAASFLAAAGRRPVAIDDAFGNARLAGLPVTIPDAA